MKKFVYAFHEGNKDMRDILGGKGANLAEMTNLGLPIPQGFTITTEACTDYYENNQKISEEIQERYISRLRCIPFSSLGKNNGMLLGIRVNEINVETEEENKISNNVIIGIYNQSLTKRGEYRALIGIELI